MVAVDHIGQLGRSQQPGRNRRRRGGDPAIVVDGAVAKHLEVLRLALRWGVGVSLVEGVRHAHAFDWFLGDAVHTLPAENKKPFAHQADVYGAYVAYTDYAAKVGGMTFAIVPEERPAILLYVRSDRPILS